MTRQEKINKVARFCASNSCRSCEARGACLIRTGGRTWGNVEEGALDAMVAAIDNAGKPTAQTANDPVNHPSHYTAGGVECIDAMVSAFGAREVSNYCICNAFKYIFRHERKNGEEDIAKAEWYLAKYRELRYGTLENH